jgi:hypothetical protein
MSNNVVVLCNDMETYTRQEFEGACIKLLGEKDYSDYKKHNYNVPDFCTLVAKRVLLDELKDSDRDVLRVIQVTAYNLWRKDGCTGLTGV